MMNYRFRKIIDEVGMHIDYIYINRPFVYIGLAKG